MAIEITRPGKTSLIVESPVMPMAGMLGFGDVYRDLINFEKLGAFVTHPITYQPWQPATGTRVIKLDAGILVHTGLPNPGLSKTIKRHRNLWRSLPLPVIVHLIGTTAQEVAKSASRLDSEDAVAAVELGLNDDISWQDAEQMVRAAARRLEKPLLVRLPLYDALALADVVIDAGADALTVAAPPRGTAFDTVSGRFIGGRIFGPLVKPMALRIVGALARRFEDTPIIGAGGIHSPEDAREFIMAGARAVQVDAITWIQPSMLERIARDLGGMVITRSTTAMADEWHPGMGDTEKEAKAPTEKHKKDKPD